MLVKGLPFQQYSSWMDFAKALMQSLKPEMTPYHAASPIGIFVIEKLFLLFFSAW